MLPLIYMQIFLFHTVYTTFSCYFGLFTLDCLYSFHDCHNKIGKQEKLWVIPVSFRVFVSLAVPSFLETTVVNVMNLQ